MLYICCFCITDLQVFAYTSSQKWDKQGEYGTKTEFSVDTTLKSGNGEYSIKINNIAVVQVIQEANGSS